MNKKTKRELTIVILSFLITMYLSFIPSLFAVFTGIIFIIHFIQIINKELSENTNNKIRKPLIRKIFSDNQYEWMMNYLPTWFMYKQTYFDGHHILWPRWGHTKKQQEEAKKKAKELMSKIKWE